MPDNQTLQIVQAASALPISQLSQFNFAQIGIQTVAIFVTALVLPGLVIRGIFSALLTVLALGYINTKIWDAALFLQIPDSLSTQAITLLLCNGALFWVVVKLLPGIDISGIVSAILAPIIFSATSLALDQYFKNHTLTDAYHQVSSFIAPVTETVSDGVSGIREKQKHDLEERKSKKEEHSGKSNISGDQP